MSGGAPARLRGMVDLLPGAMTTWHVVEEALRRTMAAYGYAEMRTPIVERTALFERSIGESTDIVEKEMYTFEDRKGERVSLRPENTASCVRAAIEGAMLANGASARVWYQGPMFRYERPQLGRQRQFHQAGAEAYGLKGPAIECELIALSARLWRELGIGDALTLEINTLGTNEDRMRWREALVAHFTEHEAMLDEDSARRLKTNPLRILDTKNPAMQDLVAAAPKLDALLGDDSRAHFEGVRALLRDAGIEARVNPRLVRGLDYYSHTVHEWVTDRLGAQSAVCSGGRYDDLVVELGARDGAGVGWALGMERIVALVDQLGTAPGAPAPDAYLICTDDVPPGEAFALAEGLRAGGGAGAPARCVVQDLGAGGMKARFKRADRSGARAAVVVGAEELAAGEVTLKPLREAPDAGGARGEQRRVPRAALDAALAELLGGAG